MIVIVQRHLAGQAKLGLFTNLWPTWLCRIDRRAMAGWYCALHLGTFRLTILG